MQAPKGVVYLKFIVTSQLIFYRLLGETRTALVPITKLSH
jgi:hypothetical protein